MEKQKAKYFCENCGSEVPANARFCPKCGKFFSSVRCPKCGFTGDVKTFKFGCPQCGYAMPNISKDSNVNPDGTKKHNLGRKSRKQIDEAFSVYESKSNKKNNGGNSDDVPAWLFGICIIVLIAIIAFIIMKINS